MTCFGWAFLSIFSRSQVSVTSSDYLHWMRIEYIYALVFIRSVPERVDEREAVARDGDRRTSCARGQKSEKVRGKIEGGAWTSLGTFSASTCVNELALTSSSPLSLPNRNTLRKTNNHAVGHSERPFTARAPQGPPRRAPNSLTRSVSLRSLPSKLVVDRSLDAAQPMVSSSRMTSVTVRRGSPRRTRTRRP